MDETTFAVSTLGCRVNRADSLAIERALSALGFERAAPADTPDIWIVNTCAVTAEGARKSRKLVRRCAATGSRVVVTGCAAVLEPALYREIEGVEAVVHNDSKGTLVADLFGGASASHDAATYAPSDLARVPVKVQDGCGRHCTYCVVPYLRGTPGCRRLPEVLAEVRELRERGVGEIIICGIDLGSYRDEEGGARLEGLVESVLAEAGDTWVRLSSLELSDASDELLSLMRSSAGLMSHLHVPVQSGDARVLADMGRHYAPAEFLARVAEARDAVPGLSVTTDVMAGFPTEDDEAHDNTMALLGEGGFSRVHVFRYSPRPFTAAEKLCDPVPAAVKERRAAQLRELAAVNAERFHARCVGRIMPVLVEAPMQESGRLFGRAESFAGVFLTGGRELVGKKVMVEVTGAAADGITGEVVGEVAPQGQGR